MKFYQIDAFTDTLFCGNPAAVVPLTEWLPDSTMQSIAQENNLSETAFFVSNNDRFEIRWFTPAAEVDLCGHATLAAAWVIYHELQHQAVELIFESKSGELRTGINGELITLNFPTMPTVPIDMSAAIIEGLGAMPVEVRAVVGEDYLVVLPDQETVEDIDPDWQHLIKLPGRGVIITALANEPDIDFVSRAFYPKYGINEDPVTGSAHTKLVPYWADRLKKSKLVAKQLSKRGGQLWCELLGDRTLIGGKAVKYCEGELFID